MTSRSTHGLTIALAVLALTACGSHAGTSSSPSAVGPSTPDGMPPIRTSPFPTVSVDPNDPTVAQCRADVTTVTNATELFNRQKGYYAPDIKTLVEAGLLTSVPPEVHYGYDAPNVDPVVIGTIAGC